MSFGCKLVDEIVGWYVWKNKMKEMLEPLEEGKLNLKNPLRWDEFGIGGEFTVTVKSDLDYIDNIITDILRYMWYEDDGRFFKFADDYRDYSHLFDARFDANNCIITTCFKSKPLYWKTLDDEDGVSHFLELEW